MVTVLIGDLFESRAQTLVNTVNCVGIMGKGLALQFKQRFPEMFEDYARRCRDHQVRLGEPYLYRRIIEPWRGPAGMARCRTEVVPPPVGDGRRR